jgi:eukaryotic-like serine/threonine-protein kinase
MHPAECSAWAINGFSSATQLFDHCRNIGASAIKLSDFGLAKDQASEFTRTQTEMRGTIRAPQLVSFKAYDVRSEVYAIGWVLAYIFTGRESPQHGEDVVSRIIQKCTNSDIAQRYQDVPSIIADVDRLEAVQPGISSETRAVR